MDYTTRRSQGGLFEGLYRVLMRRNSIYVTFIIAGAFAGERAVDYGVKKLWEHNNVGLFMKLIGNSLLPELSADLDLNVLVVLQKRYEDIPVLGQRQSEE
ncbi:hypothetical protein JRO89_XS12G0105800 [Xanthoceras sorbifolium]|uniref:Cytochrome b-c1 complex subunit 9 n=1 Tax=Xanthoceras sorbifolium TaxID=99658 RepID=A0ABQ8HC69_9ROSI|nr:hypothetical protein JRO89_XS12G0105800 [Xanthoceras sorbifolium]